VWTHFLYLDDRIDIFDADVLWKTLNSLLEDIMKRSFLTTLALVFAVLIGISSLGFQCSSPNVTSGKMYYQQYEASMPKDTNKLNLALESFQKEVNEKPNSAEGWYWVGFVYGIKKNYIRTYEAWDKSKKSGPEKADDIKANSLYFWSQAYNNGTNIMKKARIKKDPALYAQAVENFKAASMLEPDTTARYGGFVTYAYALINQDRYDEAVEPLNQQLKRNPNADAYRLLGLIYTDRATVLKKAGKEADAAAQYNAAISLLNEGLVKYPENTDLNQEVLNAYVAANKVTEAKSKFKDYAMKNPNDKNAQFAYGTVLLETKDYEEAIVYLEKALILDPKHESAMYNLCAAYIKQGLKMRESLTEKSTEAEQKSYKDLIKKALPYLQQMLKLQPDVITNWDLAGKIYTTLGMTKEATEAYAQIEKLKKAEK
jgi:tetratricopeptide (TPR) repeat protein